MSARADLLQESYLRMARVGTSLLQGPPEALNGAVLRTPEGWIVGPNVGEHQGESPQSLEMEGMNLREGDIKLAAQVAAERSKQRYKDPWRDQLFRMRVTPAFVLREAVAHGMRGLAAWHLETADWRDLLARLVEHDAATALERDNRLKLASIRLRIVDKLIAEQLAAAWGAMLPRALQLTKATVYRLAVEHGLRRLQADPTIVIVPSYAFPQVPRATRQRRPRR